MSKQNSFSTGFSLLELCSATTLGFVFISVVLSYISFLMKFETQIDAKLSLQQKAVRLKTIVQRYAKTHRNIDLENKFVLKNNSTLIFKGLRSEPLIDNVDYLNFNKITNCVIVYTFRLKIQHQILNDEGFIEICKK